MIFFNNWLASNCSKEEAKRIWDQVSGTALKANIFNNFYYYYFNTKLNVPSFDRRNQEELHRYMETNFKASFSFGFR